MKKYDIFISYSRKDFEEVNAIVEMLKSRIPTLNCWFDITGIESGDEFEEKIIAAIDNSSYVLFALSDNAIESKYAKKEVMYAQAIETKVIPLLLKDSQLKGWFLFNFGRIDCIDSTNSLQMEKLIKNLSDWTGKAMVDIPQNSPQNTSLEIQTFCYENGEKYEGQIQNGVYNGQGTYYYRNGEKQYEGQFKDGKRHGQGTYYFENGNRFEGQFENDDCNGQGIYQFADGGKYEGEVKNGILHGQGTYYHEDGSKYEGQFKDGKQHGIGTFYLDDGSKYVGQFENGKINGQGTMYLDDGFKYYENKYNETLKNYDFQKNQFEQLIVLPISEIMGNNKVQWEIDFH